MSKRRQRSRLTLALTLFLALCAGTVSPRAEVAQAKPLGAVDELNIFISEFRTRGPGIGGLNPSDDEFVEIFNASGNPIDINGWNIRRSAGCGGAAATPLASVPAAPPITLAPGQYYLFARTGSYSGSTLENATISGTGIADDGGIALFDNLGNLIDQVGMCSTTGFKEGTSLSPLSGTANQSYERKTGGIVGSCKDTDNNSADFQLNSSSSNPQNFLSPLSPCLVVKNIKALSPNGIYSLGQTVDIEVEFTNNVNVTGTPTLLLETGTVDQNAFYIPGTDGDTTLTFRYTVTSNDTSPLLDYVSAIALSLNGGSITGAIGNATLILPKPGTGGSLAVNSNIQIDAAGSPTILSIKRQNPLSSPTNSDSLVFQVIFSEIVTETTVEPGDFVVVGSLASVTSISSVNSYTFDLTVSGGNLDNLNADVGIDIAPSANITDLFGNIMPTTPEPTIDEVYTLDNIPPTIVSINQAATQIDPTSSQPVLFTIIFSEPIDASTLTASAIGQNTVANPATNVVWRISATSDPKIYGLSATVAGDAINSGILSPMVFPTRVKDLAGNENTGFTDGNCGAQEPNNCVQINVTDDPTVAIRQAASQPDPATTLPVNFTVQFSEPINTATFTAADITQTGTAAGVTWNITNSGDNVNFTLSATSASGFGTIAPSMAANRVLDSLGNNNTPSDPSADHSVNYIFVAPTRTPTPTRTSTPAQSRAVVINEVAWAGTSSALTDDEWIELYNPGNRTVNITGWRLRTLDGSPDILLNGTIRAKGYFLLERDNDSTVSDILANQIYTGALSNDGEILILYDQSNRIIDTANSSGGSWPAGSSSTYGSMERVIISYESDSAWRTNTGAVRNGRNANGGDILGTPKRGNSPLPTATPTPLRTPTSTPTFPPVRIPIDPRPIINEVLARPGFDWNQDGKADVFDEFIEIKNLTAIDISLSGWKLDSVNGKKAFSLPALTLKPGERAVFYSKQTNLLLSDGGETVRLINSSGKIYDAFTYNLARAEDKSFCRLPDGNPGDRSWFEDCLPTPNLTNSREGKSPESINGDESPSCSLPDTLPPDFFIPECRGYGADIWNPFYWDQLSGAFRKWIQDGAGKWDTFIE